MTAALAFQHPWLLALLPLALLLLLARRGAAQRNTWLVTGLPRDRASDVLQWLLRGAAVLALAALVVAVAEPYRPEVQVQRIGRGAQIVLVLDRSRSMDQGFAGARSATVMRGTGPEALDYYATLRSDEARNSKGKVARLLLSQFAQSRHDDRFAMVVFSSVPMRVLGFTQKPDAVQAAISAGNIGRGLSETHIGLALESALTLFENQPYTGSRIVLLVSDGGDRLDVDARNRITELARQLRVSLYWIYIRSPRSPGLLRDAPASAEEATAPEASLHRFFETLQVPYRAYEADNPEALQQAVADVDRLENLPIAYADTLPRRDLAPFAHATALAALLLLLAAAFAELRP